MFHKSILLHLRVSLSQRCTVLTPKDPLEVVINKSHYYYVPLAMPARTMLSDHRRLLAAIAVRRLAEKTSSQFGAGNGF